MRLFDKSKPASESLEEHRMTLPGIDIAINHALKLVVVVDQTGITDDFALAALSDWIEKQGYFMHATIVLAPTESKEQKT